MVECNITIYRYRLTQEVPHKEGWKHGRVVRIYPGSQQGWEGNDIQHEGNGTTVFTDC